MPLDTLARVGQDLPSLSEENDSSLGDDGRFVDPLVRAAAQSIIDYSVSKSKPIQLEAFDTPPEALVSISEQLDELGTSHIVKATLLDAMKDYVMSKGGNFARAANAKPVYIALNVASARPDFKFEEGVTEMAAMDSKVAQVEGSAGINVRLTASGTAMTSNMADVDKMFASSKGTKLWIQFEAPTSDHLDGLMTQQEIAMAAVGEAMGASMSAAELQDVLNQLQDAGEVSPELISLLESLIETRALTETEITPEVSERLSELQETISEALAQGIEDGTIPQVLVSAVTDMMADIGQKNAVESVLDVPEHDGEAANIDEAPEGIDEAAQVDALIEQLTELAATEGLDPEVVDAINAQIEALQEYGATEGADLSAVLADVKEELANIAATESIPDSVYQSISEILPVVVELSQAATPVPITDQLPALAEAGAEDLLDLIEQLDAIDNLPPEIQEVLEKINLEALTPEIIERALVAGAETDFGATLQELVSAINNPDVQAALSQDALSNVSEFLNSQDALADAVATQEVIQSLETALDNVDLDTPEGQKVQEIVESLKKGETSLDALDTAVLAEAAKGLEGFDPAVVDQIVQTAENTSVSEASVPESADVTAPEASDVEAAAPETTDVDAPAVSEADVTAPEAGEVDATAPETTDVDAPAGSEVEATTPETSDVEVLTVNEVEAETSTPETGVENTADTPATEAAIDNTVDTQAIDAVDIDTTTVGEVEVTVPDTNGTVDPSVSVAEAAVGEDKISPAPLDSDVSDNLKAMTLMPSTPDNVVEAINNVLENPQDQTARQELAQVVGEKSPIAQALADDSNQTKPVVQEEPSFQTGCSSCSGGDCASCKGAFDTVSEGNIKDLVKQTIDTSFTSQDNTAVPLDQSAQQVPVSVSADANNVDQNEARQPQQQVEEPSFQTGCGSCAGGDCASCKGAFDTVREGDVQNLVKQTINTSFTSAEAISDVAASPVGQPVQQQSSNDVTETQVIPTEEPSFQTGCAACAGGDCASCKGAFDTVTGAQVTELANKIDWSASPSSSVSDVTSPVQVTPVETPSFQAGCGSCAGGDCASCKGAFDTVNTEKAVEIAGKIDLSSISASDAESADNDTLFDHRISEQKFPSLKAA